ncbi:hypothetical protein ACEPAF_1314 [Sanghuangporus sanghuang]
MSGTTKEIPSGTTQKKRVWVITGTSSGLGRTLVHVALARGDYVVATARKLNDLSEFSGNPETASRVHTMKLDVTASFSELHVLAGEVIEKWGRVDVLVNNAGSCLLGMTEEIGAEGYQKQFDVNFFGQLNVANAFLPYMRAQREGTIVFVGSRSSWRTNVPMLGPYASSKAAITAAAEALAVEVAPFGIKVLNVLPGGLKQSRTWHEYVFLPTVPDALLPPVATLIGPGTTQVRKRSSERPSEPEPGATETDEQHIADYVEMRKRVISWAKTSSSGINGDVEKSAQAIVDVVCGDARRQHSHSSTDGEIEGANKTLSWPDLNMLILGTDAEANIRDKCNAILKSLDEWKEVVRGIALEN